MLAGAPVVATEFEALGPPVVHVVASFAAGVIGSAVHGDVMSRDLAACAGDLRDGAAPERLPLAGLVGAGFETQLARRSARFTVWDGNLAGEALPSTGTVPLSASRLETWAACGFRYYLGHVLGLADRDDPERVVELSALDRGSGLHHCLERFVAEAIEGGIPEPDHPWSDAARARLGEIATEVFAGYAARGRTGRALRWRLEEGMLLRSLDKFLDADNEQRAGGGTRPARVELPFGLDGAEPVRIELADGRVLFFRGRADRVDVGNDGRAVVFDYKSGKGDEVQDTSPSAIRSRAVPPCNWVCTPKPRSSTSA